MSRIGMSSSTLKSKDSSACSLFIFGSYSASLCCRYEKKLVTLDKDCRETQKLYDELVVKFGENNSVDSEELFGFIKVFVEKFRDMCVKLDAPKKEKAESVSP